MKKNCRGFSGLVGCLCLAVGLGPALAQEDQAPAPFELSAMDCGELDNDAGLRPLRPTHTAGEDQDLLCKVTVSLPAGAKGTPKAHSVTLSVFEGKQPKARYQEVRDARLLAAGSRVILFVVPAEKLPSDGGKVRIRAELSKPAAKPGFREVSYDLNNED